MVKINMNGNYLAECVRLLYWIYFKPFTLAEWLRDIHPDLKPNTNPFTMRAEFRVNPKLLRYAEQFWFLKAATTIVPVILFCIIYFFSIIFNWSSLSISTTILQLTNWVFISINSSLRKTLKQIISMVFSIIFLIIISLIFSPELTPLIPHIVLLQYLIPFQVDWMVGDVAADVARDVGLGVMLSVGLGVVLGMAFGVLFSGASSFALGVTLGVASSVALNVAFILGILQVYFWIPELLLMFFLWQFVPEGDKAKWLRRLPPYFDQLIHLPMPWMDSFIVKAYHQNPVAAQQTIDYLINSTNQQKVALKAMVGIAIDTLNRCQNSEDIVTITEQLAWIPSPPPAEIGSVLPEFLEISQDVRAAENASSAYLQSEMLATPLTKLNRLRESLVLRKNAALATNFGSIVQGWLSILETSQQTLEEAALDSAEIPQVYVAGPALNPENSSSRFKGRLDVFREIEYLARSSQPPVLLLYGGRRTGKTSALKFLPQKVGSDLVPLSIDFQGAAMTITLSGLAEFIADEIVEAARRNRNLQLPAIDRESLKIDPFMALQKWFVQIEKFAPGKRFLLCLDEFERLEEVVKETGSRSPLNFLRYILQHRANWILLFSGSHTLDELNPYWNDFLINTQSLRMTYLQEAEARDLIRNPVANFPDIYTEAAIYEIIYLTRCQPYYVQLMCRVLVDRLNAINREKTRLNQEKQRQLTADDVQAAILKSLEQGGATFRVRYQELTESEREFLHKLIDEPVLAVAESRSWPRLVEKEVLEVTEEGYRFQVPLFQKFVEIQSRQ